MPNSALINSIARMVLIPPGRDSPPTSNNMLTSSIPVWDLAFVGVVTGLSEVLIVFLIAVNIIWRKNA